MRKKRNITIKCLIIFMVCITTSCTRHTHLYLYQTIDTKGWDKKDTLAYRLCPPLPAHTETETLIGIRHTDSYPYRDIWLTVNNDTLHIYLTDEKGKWKGKGVGPMKNLTVPITLSENQDTIDEIRITHIMQDNPLTGISDVGLSIKEMP